MKKLMTTAALAIVAIIVGIGILVVPTAQAGELTSVVRDGSNVTWVYADAYVKSFGVDLTGKTVAIACGEKTGDFAGNNWLRGNPAPEVVAYYTVTPPETAGGNWTFKVPESMKTVDKVRHNLVIIENGAVQAWLPIDKFSLTTPYVNDGKGNNGIVLSTK